VKCSGLTERWDLYTIALRPNGPTIGRIEQTGEVRLPQLGFVGLGIMGAPMAQNLSKAGHQVTVWSHNSAKAKSFAEANGAHLAPDPAGVAAASECVFLCVGDTEMSRQVILGERGLLSGAKRGSIIADCSTISPSASVQMAKAVAEKGIEFLDAPCTGSKAGAEGATLTFMVGGSKATFEKARPWFEAMGKTFYYCGEQGMGLRAKLTQNLILGNLLQAFNEGFVMSTKAGVDPELMLEILNDSAARTGLISAKAPAVFRRDFSTNFSVKWLEKDMSLMVDAAAELNIPVPLTALSQQLLRTAIAKGFGDEDICGSIRLLEDIAGVQVEKKSK
jgi:3-hydroxyisobutyrate dehydrogenase-like beta-hydroxyacid dehydrogenase